MKHPIRPFLPVLALVAAGVAFEAKAQLSAEEGAFRVTVDAYANGTVAGSTDSKHARQASGVDGQVDSEVRTLGLFDLGGGYALGGRVVGVGRSDSGRALGDNTIVFQAPWGRLEYGQRRGLPDVLTGYAPNAYQFVSAEYGPVSGLSLDPDGALQTVFIEPLRRSSIDALTSLGITSAFFQDTSEKALYVSPDLGGLQFGASYASEVDNVDERYAEMTQAGLVYETGGEAVNVRLGGSYTYADGQRDVGSGLQYDQLHSFSVGGNVIVDRALRLGASVTYNDDRGLPKDAPAATEAYGWAVSGNYTAGAWTVGGFYQHARHEDDAFVAGEDEYRAVQAGLGYVFSKHVSSYGAAYFYDFDDDAILLNSDDTLLLVGTRIEL